MQQLKIFYVATNPYTFPSNFDTKEPITKPQIPICFEIYEIVSEIKDLFLR